jgi:hypothetical protein
MGYTELEPIHIVAMEVEQEHTIPRQRTRRAMRKTRESLFFFFM